MFIEVNDFSPGNVCKLIWFCDEYFLHHLCGYLVVYLTDSRFRFFRIILVMFGQHLLYVIAKGMRMLIDVSFFGSLQMQFCVFSKNCESLKSALFIELAI